jgi:Transposase DDE domain
MLTLPHLAQVIQTILTAVADAVAQETGFVERKSKMTGAKFAQTLVFGWLDNPAATYEQLAQTATALGVPITAQGLENRFTPEAAACVKGILERAVQQVMAATPVAIPLCQRFNGVYIQDSTTIGLPDVLAPEWPGCGGNSAHNTQAALKVQVQLNLSDGQLTHLDLQAGRAQDKTAPMQTAPLPAGALRLADLGYFSIPTLAQYEAQGVCWLTRYDPRCLVFDVQTQPMDLGALLQRTTEDRFDLPIQLSQQHQFRCRLVAVRVPPEVAAERRRKARAAARREGRTLSPKQLTLLDWTLFLTNVPASVLSVDEVLVLARVRWQIELLFKLWKQQGQVDESRSQKPDRILCEVYAKLLGLLIQHWLLVAHGWQHANRSWFKAGQTIRQHSLRLGCALASLAQMLEIFETLAHCFAVGARLNTRKAKPNTVQRLLALAEHP